MKNIQFAFFVWVVVVFSANASDAGVASASNDNIQLVSEYIKISNSKVVVTYRFLNTSDRDIRTTTSYGFTPGFSEGREFVVTFDGNPVDFEAANLEKIFPAGKEIEVTKEYIPEIKRYVQNLLREDGCPDEGSQKGIDRLILENKKRGYTSNVIAERIQYPFAFETKLVKAIKELRLQLNKGETNRMVSLCFPGKPKKVSPTEYVFTQSDYIPQDVLTVYFVEVAKGIEIESVISK
jgi:hypothetical protein